MSKHYTTDFPANSPYDRFARSYLEAGWFPIPVTGKFPPHSGATGSKAGLLTQEQCLRWLDVRSAGINDIALRHQGTMSIDVDVYKDKFGHEELSRFAEERGLPPLPPTYTSTARGQATPSRQYVYRVHTDVRFSKSPAPGVDICQQSHRYTACFPTVHPDYDTQYAWYLPGTEGLTWAAVSDHIPNVSDLPYLPAEWVEALRSPHANYDELDWDADVVVADDLVSGFLQGSPSKIVQMQLDKLEEAHQSSHIGHAESVKFYYNAFRLGREGHPGVIPLLSRIRGYHYEYLQSARPERAYEADKNFRDMSEYAQRIPVDPNSVYRPAITPLAPLSTLGAITPLGVSQPQQQASQEEPPAGYWVLPDWVWEKSKPLGCIRQAAVARQASPDVVLHAVLAIIASTLHHETTLRTGKGDTQLTYFTTAVGGSGSSKSLGFKAARDLIRPWWRNRQEAMGEGKYFVGNIGSGEGIVEGYMGWETIPVPVMMDGEPLKDDDGNPITKDIKTHVQVRHNALYSADEGRQVLSIASRTGSTILSVLCSLWSGENPGTSAAKAENTRNLEEGTFVAGVIMGFQPTTIEALFGDQGQGVPQRFTYASARHPDIMADEVDFPEPLNPPVPLGHIPFKMWLNDAARKEVRAFAPMVNQMEDGLKDIDGHRLLLHCRLAALLAVLHGEHGEVSEEWWELARTVLDTSCGFRDHLMGRVSREEAEASRRKSQQQVEVSVASAAEIDRFVRVRRVADRLVELVEGTDSVDCTVPKLRKRLTKNDRPVCDEAVNLAVDDGRLFQDEIDNPRSGPARLLVLRLTDD